MKKLLNRFWLEEDGLGTVELVIIIAVLVAVALLFRDYITGFVKRALSGIFGSEDGESIDINTNIGAKDSK